MHTQLDDVTSWGRETVCLDLPLGPLRFEGLTERQRSGIAEAYPLFVVSQPPGGVDGTDCRACRLDGPLGLSPDTLAVNGHYSPRTARLPTGGIGLTGFEFTAHMLLDRAPAVASLGVAREEDLANPIVIENFLRIFTAHRALGAGGAMLHSAGLVVDGRAYIFVGRSGAGKTTLTRKAHRAGVTILSDDINLLLPAAEGFDAHSLPFMGEFGPLLSRANRRGYPVAGLVCLDRGPELRVQTLPPSAAVACMFAGCPFVNGKEEETEGLLDILSGIAASVPAVRLASRRDSPIDSIMSAVRENIDNARQ